jgi:putative toxin-antitoxin system antitoxin component (TIGR02293 family)
MSAAESKTQSLSAEEKLLRAVFGVSDADFVTDGPEAPAPARKHAYDVKWSGHGDTMIYVAFKHAYRADPMELVTIVKRGVPAESVQAVARLMSISKERLADTLGLASATVNRKSRDRKPLSSDETSRVVGMARLVGQVQAMVEESGDPEGFDAATWVAQWLEQPLPALGGRRPAELMDTPEGQSLVSNLVSRLQTGAYA